METELRTSRVFRGKERADKRKLRFETDAWRKAAAGLLIISTLTNMALMAHIGRLKEDRAAVCSQYEQRIEHMENIRDMAVQQLGAAVLQNQRDAQARAKQAAAYETIGVYQYVGQCKVTAYCPCKECCGMYADGLTATGIPAGPGIVAVDPERIPLGSTVVIDGQKYLAADTGVTGLHVDVCLADHASTVEHGVRMAQVWVVEDDEW